MARARGDSGLDGFVNLCKPAGPTSHDLVARARRALGTRRVGHAGTLDPTAEGVLPLALGRATRLVEQLAGADKEYYAEARLGVRTTTDDLEGEPVEQRDVPHFELVELELALAGFVGEIQQRPPAFSALKLGGQRAYQLARAGRPPELAARSVQIYAIEPRGWDRPVLSFRVRCAKGTYIRSLVRDLGERLDTGAVLQRLVRTAVGPFLLRQAVSIEQLEQRQATAVFPADLVLTDLPAIVLSETHVGHLRHGRSWPAEGGSPGAVRAYTYAGLLAGLVELVAGHWQPRLSFLD